MLVFMVDSADRLRLPWARQELQKLLDKDPDLPVIVVANKQVRTLGGGLQPRHSEAHMERLELLSPWLLLPSRDARNSYYVLTVCQG